MEDELDVYDVKEVKEHTEREEREEAVRWEREEATVRRQEVVDRQCRDTRVSECTEHPNPTALQPVTQPST